MQKFAIIAETTVSGQLVIFTNIYNVSMFRTNWKGTYLVRNQ